MPAEEFEEKTLEESLEEAFDEVEGQGREEGDDSSDTEGTDDSGPNGEDDRDSDEDGDGDLESGSDDGDEEEEEDGSSGGSEEGFEEEEEEEGSEEGEEEELEAGDLEPAQHWPDEIKEEFAELPAKSQKFLIKSMKGMQGDYTRKTQGIADLVSSLDPIKEECVQAGVTYADAVRRFVGVHKRLQTDPRNAILYVMQEYGITVDQIFNQGGASGATDPETAKEIASLREEVQASRQMVQDQNSAQLNASLAEFRESHEHYDEVEPDMTQIVNGLNASGLPIPPLQELYDRACWANPTVREKLFEEQKEEKAKEQVTKRKKRIAKSKKAARTARKTSATESRKTQQRMGLREQLADAMDAVESRH
jgi:hypothetical protein